MPLPLTLQKRIKEKEKRKLIKPKIALRTTKLALSLISRAKQNAILLVTLITRKDIYLRIKGA